jgi:ABC-2 type transport system ATP-binding protein
VLEVNAVSKQFGVKQVLDRFDFTVNAGEVVAVTGENGCGKSTLLKLCSGLISPDSGTVTRRGVLGYCPQDPGLLPRLTIDEHLAVFGVGMGLAPRRALIKGRGILRSLGIPDTENTRIGALSGGTRQKVNLALALLNDPDLLLLDEPYQGFDHGTYVDFWDLVDDWRDEGKAVVIITHLLTETKRADRLEIMRRVGVPASPFDEEPENDFLPAEGDDW